MQPTTDFHQAELNAAQAMRSWGFLDAVATTGGSDGGVDVRAHDALAQVKWRTNATGRPEVQQLVGARGSGRQTLFFFSKSGYTRQAVEYADTMGVALFVIDAAGGVTPVNGHARPYGAKWWALPFVGITRDDWVVLGLFTLALVGAAVFWLLYLG
ncbi:restriction endonuclease [Rhodococcus sp. HS-D2]|uniref:restriction endonuclease n=1 Tax=Rhodococcus sp. HS-D2 TaxID=1384636 RepID=UPI0007DA3230|nr:restriction endonuclease [Rhodococcus sp. HS-D2]